MPAMPLLLPIFKLARTRALPFVPIRPLLTPLPVAPQRPLGFLDHHALVDHASMAMKRRVRS